MLKDILSFQMSPWATLHCDIGNMFPTSYGLSGPALQLLPPADWYRELFKSLADSFNGTQLTLIATFKGQQASAFAVLSYFYM
jgi:hypothetical protein